LTRPWGFREELRKANFQLVEEIEEEKLSTYSAIEEQDMGGGNLNKWRNILLCSQKIKMLLLGYEVTTYRWLPLWKGWNCSPLCLVKRELPPTKAMVENFWSLHKFLQVAPQKGGYSEPKTQNSISNLQLNPRTWGSSAFDDPNGVFILTIDHLGRRHNQ
jgi:hypothetical protein